MLLQAYTVELEAELNQLKDENAQLKLSLVRIGTYMETKMI